MLFKRLNNTSDTNYCCQVRNRIAYRRTRHDRDDTMRLYRACLYKCTTMELDMQQVIELYPGVVADPQILGGKPVIKGTRVPVSLVLSKVAGGMSMDEVRDEYYLTDEGIRAAFGYAAQQVEQDTIVVTRQ